MQLLSFKAPGATHTEVGLLAPGDAILSLHRLAPQPLLAPSEGMQTLIERWATLAPQVQALHAQLWGGVGSAQGAPTANLKLPDLKLADVHLLAPLPRPGKVLAIGLNYLEHVNESIVGESRSVPEHQVWFTKLANAINGPFDDIVLPCVSDKTDYEAELVAVIGQRCKHVSREQAPGVVFGCCVGNDVSVRDWQKRTSQWTLGKSFDTHAPFGPWLTTADAVPDVHALDMRCWVNGELRQSSNTRLMMHTLWDQIALLSQAMTLEPGDVIFTGTCSGVGAAFDPPRFLRSGDVVRIEIERLGAIEARCVDEA